MRRAHEFAVSLAAAALVAGCGPSLKTLVESDMRFEHCYRIDDDAQTPASEKRACWSDWNARYARGQDRSRVSYAKDRMAVLNGAGSYVPPQQAMAASAAPLSPYAPPPATAAVKENPGETDATKPKAQVCSDACTEAWRVCITPCGKGSACFNDCEVHLKACTKACI